MEKYKRIIVTDKVGNDYVFNNAIIKDVIIKHNVNGRKYTVKLETDYIKKIVVEGEVTK